MNLRALRTLSVIARRGSFTGAANELNMTLSAVSMQMNALEQELDAALFDRTHRPPRLTPEGRHAAALAEQIDRLADEMRSAPEGDTQLTGQFRLGFVSTASVRLLPDFLNRARREAPKARFAIETGLSEALEERVAAGHLDGAIVTALPRTTRVSYRILREEPLALALPSEAVGDDSLPFLQFSAESGIGKVISRHPERPATARREIIVLDSVEAIMECVNRGIGMTLLTRADIDRYAEPGIRVEPVTEPPLTRSLALALPPHRANSPQTEMLAELLR